MTDEFKPPIKSRTTKELLAIAGAPKKWNVRALKLALQELDSRKVDRKQIDQAKYIEKRHNEFETLKKAKESFHFLDFIFEPVGTFFEFFFSWELKNEGYILKAQQQKKYRPIVFVLILVLVLLIYIFT